LDDLKWFTRKGKGGELQAAGIDAYLTEALKHLLPGRTKPSFPTPTETLEATWSSLEYDFLLTE
jgi:hypothetical protein